MKVAMVTGSYPPDACGVGDYSAQLVTYLRKAGVDVAVFSDFRWVMSDFIRLIKEIKQFQPDIIHIQYPTIGYGKSLLPQMLSIVLAPCVVTLHEASQVHWLRRLSLYPFTLRTRCIIMTSDFERGYFTKIAPWIKHRLRVIKIGGFANFSSKQAKDLTEITYFGLIRPKKGLEEFLKLSQLAHQQGINLTFRIIGQPDARSIDYYHSLRAQSTDWAVEWVIGQEVTVVAELLGRTRIAYLPFPDGASERRSSLIAMLSSGVAVVTTNGEHTPRDMETAVAFAQSPHEAIDRILSLQENNEECEKLMFNAINYAKSFSWKEIQDAHIRLYEQVTELTV